MTTQPSTSIVPGATAIPIVVPTVAPANDSTFPTTEAQFEIWLSSKQSVEANCAYNEITSFKFSGELNRDVLRHAVAEVVQRHGALRATISDDGQAMTVAPFGGSVNWQYMDWNHVGEDETAVKRLQLLQNEACTPFDLEQGPLFRVILQRTAAQEHFLTVTAHHIVLDGWSLGVFSQDLAHFYDRGLGKSPDPLPTAISYRDYSQAMDQYFASDDARHDEAYWCGQFANSIPVLDLPIDRQRPALRSYFARRYDHQFSAELIGSIRAIGAKAGCSLFNTLLTAFQSYIARISGINDFCVGIPTAGQLAMDRPELIGHCVNTMPLRTVIDLQNDFSHQLKITRKSLLDAFEHQRYSFGKLLAKLAPPRDPRRAPMLAVSFNVDPCIDMTKFGFSNLDVEVQVEPRMFENFEWFINGIIHQDKSLEFQVQYNTDLFSSVAMKTLWQGFEGFLTALCDADGQKLAHVPALDLSQRQQVLVEWNQTGRPYPNGSSLPAEFSRQAQQTPYAIAVRFEDRALTYEDVERRSNQLARYFQSQGLQVGDLVGLCVPRNENMLVTIFAVLKSGAGYVPLDPSFPADRLQYMCDQSQLKIVVAETGVRELVAQFGKPTIVVDDVTAEVAEQSTETPDAIISPRDTCYVIYTSGSTGEPKGVNVPHGAVVNFLNSMAEEPGLSADDVVLAVTTLSFDIAVLELFLPVLVGGTTVVASKAVSSDGRQIIEAIDQYGITLFQSTPASLRMMIDAGWRGHESLKVLCGGEPMPRDLIAPLLQRCQQLWNMYGPTETTVWSSIYRIMDAQTPVLIGKPIGNTQIYLLDDELQPVPVGSEGEIFIGGAGVTLGYLHQAAMTEARFVENPYFNPFVEFCNHRLYRTGDVGRFQHDGNIEFCRRNDKQVKVRGFRIELGEIESCLKAVDGVAQAVAMVREDQPGDSRLVAYWTNCLDRELTPADLKQRLGETLPFYMIPQHLVALEQMPETNNRKIDYKALPAPMQHVENLEDESEFRPTNAVQRLIARIWCQVLEIDDVGVNENFFDLGGHSLLVMRVIQEVESKTGARLSPPDFLIGTLEQLADKVALNADSLNEISEDEDDGAQPDQAVHSETHDSETDTDSASNSKAASIFEKISGFWD